MANDKMRAALEAALNLISERRADSSNLALIGRIDAVKQQLDEALKSESTPAVTVLDRFAVLPENIEHKAHEVLRLQVKKCKQERELDVIQADITYTVFSNPDLKNDTVRKAQLFKTMNNDKAYLDAQEALDKTKYALELAKIAYQRSRDTFEAYRSIAGMGARA